MQFSYYTRLTKDEGFTDTTKDIYRTINAPLINTQCTISMHQAQLIHQALREYYSPAKLKQLMNDDILTGALDAIIIEVNGSHITIKDHLK